MENTSAKITANIRNYSNNELECYMALYNGDRLIGVYKENITECSNTVEQIFDIENIDSKIKIFVWNNNMIPCCSKMID